MTDTMVAVIGAGQVGGACAQRILERGLANVALIDVAEGLAKGKALDLSQASSIEGYDSKIIGGADFSLMEDSKAVIVTAGLARKPGMTREDLLLQNARIIKPIVDNIRRYCPHSIIIMVTNPLDVMTYLAYKVSGFEKNRVIGMAGVLDSARLRFFISDKLKVASSGIEAMVLGGHGDSMVALIGHTKINGRPIEEFLSEEEIGGLIQRTRDGGAEVVSLLKTGSAYYAPSSAACEMLECILKDTKKILPVSACLSGEYGLNDVYCGVPARLGAKGIDDIVELKLSDKELSELRESANQVKESVEYLRRSDLI
ncbi:MAG: malate dehydrogenase [Candidatus Omnitrophota bacterium]